MALEEIGEVFHQRVWEAETLMLCSCGFNANPSGFTKPQGFAWISVCLLLAVINASMVPAHRAVMEAPSAAPWGSAVGCGSWAGMRDGAEAGRREVCIQTCALGSLRSCLGCPFIKLEESVLN